jgi:hypothetical protein
MDKENVMTQLDLFVNKLWEVISDFDTLNFAEIVGALEHIKFDVLTEAKTRSETTS